ncbi:Nn.00g052860.m01.CDS01 [Neocucurbitaria sp. VM-36]
MSSEKATIVQKIIGVSYFESPVVKIRVGEVEEVRTFHVHGDVLTSRSQFFAKALRGYKASCESGNENNSTEAIQWKEGLEGIVELPDDKPETFVAYLHLIYLNELPVRGSSSIPVIAPNATEEDRKKAKEDITQAMNLAVNHEYRVLANLYVLADKIQDIAAKRAILEAMVEATFTIRNDGSTTYPGIPTIDRIYAGTSASDPMREFLVDCYVFAGNHFTWSREDGNRFPHEFLFDVMVQLFKDKSAPMTMVKPRNTAKYLDKLKDHVQQQA